MKVPAPPQPLKPQVQPQAVMAEWREQRSLAFDQLAICTAELKLRDQLIAAQAARIVELEAKLKVKRKAKTKHARTDLKT